MRAEPGLTLVTNAVPAPCEELLTLTATVLLTEAAFSPTLETAYISSADRNGIFPAARWSRFSQRHNKGGNLVFVDGHSAFFKHSYVYNFSPPTSEGRLEKFNPDVMWNPNRDIP